MKRAWLASTLMTVLLAVTVVGLFSFDAEARRLGGGRSFGRQSSNVIKRQATPPKAPQRANQADRAGKTGAAGSNTRRPWGGVLGGLAAGLGLAWLANALGLGPAFANMLLIALLAMVVLAVLRAFRRPSTATSGGAPMSYQGAGEPHWQTPSAYNPTKVGNDASARPWESQGDTFGGDAPLIGSALQGQQPWGIPVDFDVDGFVATAKHHFVELQGAWDRSDMPRLRAMMTEEMAAEMQRQLADRKGVGRATEVPVLDARLLGIEDLDDVYMASVEFSGMMMEDGALSPSPFCEVWNLTKPRHGGGWLVAGLQVVQ